MSRMVVFSRSRPDGVSRTFVPPCPSPSCGDRNVVVVAAQGALNTISHITITHVWFDNVTRRVGTLRLELSFRNDTNNGPAIWDEG